MTPTAMVTGMMWSGERERGSDGGWETLLEEVVVKLKAEGEWEGEGKGCNRQEGLRP